MKAAYTKCVRAVWAADGGQRESAPPPTRESVSSVSRPAVPSPPPIFYSVGLNLLPRYSDGEISPLIWILSVLFLLRYAFLGAE